MHHATGGRVLIALGGSSAEPPEPWWFTAQTSPNVHAPLRHVARHFGGQMVDWTNRQRRTGEPLAPRSSARPSGGGSDGRCFILPGPWRGGCAIWPGAGALMAPMVRPPNRQGRHGPPATPIRASPIPVAVTWSNGRTAPRWTGLPAR